MLVTEKEKKQNGTVADLGLVSIVMPNYNSEKYVVDTVRSVLAQTYGNWELLFVDDCSTDDSLSLVRSIEDDRIRIFSMKENGGAALARNRAIEEARGSWIAFLDSDDLWMPHKLERQLSYMRENGIAFSYTDYDVINEENKVVTTFRPRLDRCCYRDILKHNHIGCLTVIYDVNRLGRITMPPEAIKREDVACWLKILKQEEYAHCLHECLAQYKVHANSVSSNKVKMAKYQWQVYRRVEGIGPFRSAYYLANWAISGILKYR